MNRRLVLGALALALLAVSAGCAGSGPLGFGDGVDERVSEDADYDWNTSANVTIDVGEEDYTALYEMENRSRLQVYGYDSLGDETPLDVRAVQFRFENGTVVDHEQIDVEEGQRRATITTPAENGTLAFTAPAGGKSFSIPTFMDGSYEVVLPPNMRVGVFLMSDVHPGDYETEYVDDRTHITWENVDARDISIQYYLQRDLYIFGGIVGLLVVIGSIGLAYYWRQIQVLEARRKELGLDIDVSDDDGGGRRRPPFR